MAHSDRWKVLVKEFPCLYDTKNPDFLNGELKARCFEQLLERCNNEGDQMNMEILKQRVSGLQLVTTWQNIRPKARQSRHRRGITSIKQLIGSNNAATDPFLEMAREFPCLWDRRDLNFRVESVRKLSYKQLLEKYNRESSVPMTMEDLKKTFSNMTRRMKYHLTNAGEIGTYNAKTDRFLEMAREFPCLWDRQDLNFRVESVRKLSYKQLLEKYNRESSVPMTMKDLKRNFYSMTRRMKNHLENATEFRPPSKKAKKDPLLELAQEFPYLWDSEHLKFRNEGLKRRGYQQLLEKYNTESTSQITVNTLKKKIDLMRWRIKLRQESRKKERSSRKDKGKRKTGKDRGPETGESSSWPQQQTSDDLTTEKSSDAEPLVNLREAPSTPPVILQGNEIVFNWCCFCGEIKNDCHQLTHDKPYERTNKIILTVNDINVEVDFRKNTTPQTVCQSCDTKLQEMYEFVKLVKKTQDKFSNVSNIDDLRESPEILNENQTYMSTSDDDNDKGNVIYDFLSISDTEFTNKTVPAPKRMKNKEEVATSRKKFRVSIDLNSMSSFCDDSNGSNYLNLNCDEETDASVVASEESVTIKKEIIESPGDIADKELFDTENAIQRTEKQQNTTTPSSETRNKLASETNSVLVIDQDTARESISAVTLAGYLLNIATEDVETLVVKEDNELTHDYDNEILNHTIRIQMRPSEAQRKNASEINSIVGPNNYSPKAIATPDDRKKVSKNAETIIKQECIVLSDDTDDEDNNDVQPNKKTKLEPTEVQDTQVLASNASKLPGTQKELLNDTTNTASVLVNQPSSDPVCVIPKTDLIALVESIVGRMLNK
ncbi:uncharacterized protein LOC134744454 [Cydia strobilella]|uniref:uncharacterized protein LOC134744454 n=1 Tax=Cydia strobilella TaxID=1100964 RepID=UPI003007A804